MVTGPGYLTSPTKRAHDVISATLCLPLLGATWLPLRRLSRRYCDNGGDYLLSQRRVGLGGQIFEIRKFRTIFESSVELDPMAPHNILDQRTDRAGNITRSLGLDETAQLFNVLKGDMSMVGPRPLLPEDVVAFSDQSRDKGLAAEWQAARELCRPGILGPGQFYAHRYQIAPPETHDEQMRKDVEYVSTASFGKDMAILASVPVELMRLGRLALQINYRLTEASGAVSAAPRAAVDRE